MLNLLDHLARALVAFSECGCVIVAAMGAFDRNWNMVAAFACMAIYLKLEGREIQRHIDAKRLGK